MAPISFKNLNSDRNQLHAAQTPEREADARSALPLRSVRRRRCMLSLLARAASNYRRMESQDSAAGGTFRCRILGVAQSAPSEQRVEEQTR
jgi:hypothetical protein